MRRKLVVGNWKMNGLSAMGQSLLTELYQQEQTLEQLDVAVCPPYVYLPLAQSILADSHIAWGAQDVSAVQPGAYTGQVAAEMLADLGCRYVIVGHSERRQECFEDDALVAAKCQRALSNQLTPILCVGETLVEFEAGNTQTVVARQVNAVLSVLKTDQVQQLVIAYEPIWAIGTGQAASSTDAEAVHQMIRHQVAEHCGQAQADQIRILYGGSVKPENAAEFFVMSNIDGGLIGGASLQAASFLAICQAAG